MIEAMHRSFGYDEFGNNVRLLAAADREEMDKGVPRAGGMVLCSKCGCTYNIHPAVQGALWATRTCDAGIVKL
jgi:hypothetical protein